MTSLKVYVFLTLPCNICVIAIIFLVRAESNYTQIALEQGVKIVHKIDIMNI